MRDTANGTDRAADKDSGSAQAGSEGYGTAWKVGAVLAGAAVTVAALKYRGLLSLGRAVEGSPALLARTAGSVDDLVPVIVSKFNQGCITPTSLQNLVSGVAASDKGLATAIAKLSLPNASDYALMRNLKDVGEQLSARGVNLHSLEELSTASGGSPGQAIGYLFRKANGIKVGIHNVMSAEAPLTSSKVMGSQKPIVLFDHVSELTAEQTAHLANLSRDGRQIFMVDPNNFKGGINFIDYARGTAEQKLQSLIAAAKKGPTLPHSLTDDQRAYQVLNAVTDQDALKIGATVIRPANKTDDVLFGQVTSKEKVEAFLARFHNPVQKQVAAETLASVEYDSFRSIAGKTRQLHEVISRDALASGIKPNSELRYLVGIDNWPNHGSASGGFISSVFRETNGLPRERFTDFSGLWFGGSKGGVRRYYVLDDMSHSGEQIEEIARDLRRDYGISRLSFATLSAQDTSRAMKYLPINGEDKALRFVPLSVKPPVAASHKGLVNHLYSEKGWLSAPSEELQAARLRYRTWQDMTRGVTGRRARTANQLNPYIVSDRTNPVSADFAREVLGMWQGGFLP